MELVATVKSFVGGLFISGKLSHEKKGKDQMAYYGVRLKALREQTGLTRGVVAGRCGISRTALSRIESGITVPSIEMMIRLSNSLGVRLPALLLHAGVILQKDTARALAELPSNGHRRPDKLTRMK